MRRFALLFVLPTLLCLGAATAALIAGTGTLYDRDVLNSHYPLKAAQAQLLREGRLPLIDPYRAGGQPLVGNLNALPLYPDNALYLLASPLWALNAHFWLHLLLAPLAGYWLGRAWGLKPPGAWATGAIYATSGYFLSLMNLYNLIAGAVLAPAFIAASLDACSQPRRGRRWLWVGGLWALLILAGDPLWGVIALLMAIGAVLARHRGLPTGTWRETWRWPAAVALGTVVALPQIVELLRILPHSYRGYWQYSVRAALAQSWDPRTALEWLVPFFFGPPDLSFWGYAFYGGNPPLLYSLYPGFLGLCLVMIAGRPRNPVSWWAWGAIAFGALLALGYWNPLIRSSFEVLPGGSLLRYPVKCWGMVAIAASVLCGLGFERVLRGDGRRRLGWLLGLGALFYGVLCWWFATAPAWFLHLLLRLDPKHLTPARLQIERVRWSGQCLALLLLVVVLAMAAYLLRRSRFGGGAMLLCVHVAAQLFLLQPLLDSDAIGPYAERPALLDAIPSDARVVHGGDHRIFGTPRDLPPKLTNPGRTWLQQSFFAELYPSSGISWGRRYDFTHSPEGLDSFLIIALTQALEKLSDVERLRILASAGVDRLLLDRPLDPAAEPLTRLLTTQQIDFKTIHVYEVVGSAPEVMMVGEVRFAPHLNAGLALLTRQEFDPLREVVIQGEGTERNAPPGTVTVVLDDVERLEVEVDSPEGGMLLTQRAHLPIYRAEVNGVPAVIGVANLQRLAVEVPAGRHQVKLWVDRRPFYWSCLAAVLALVGLGLLAGPGHWRPHRSGARSRLAAARRTR